MNRPRTAVIIEDEEDVQELIGAVFAQAGFDVHTASTGAEGVEAVRRTRPQIVTLDVELPDIDGFEVARQVREFSDSYILMLTGRDEEMDAMMGLETGADDYVIKPFRPRELRARVAALLRRPRWQETPQRTDSSRPSGGRRAAARLEHKGLVLNPRTREVELHGTPIDLDAMEFELLHTLMQSLWVPRTNADLAQKIRSGQYETNEPVNATEERNVDYVVLNLRDKLGDNGTRPQWIKSLPGGGYCIAT